MSLTPTATSPPTPQVQSTLKVKDPKKVSRFKAVCSKVWLVVKAIFSFLFCCCLCNSQKAKLKNWQEDTNQLQIDQAKVDAAKKPPIESPLVISLDSGAKFSDWDLKPTTDPWLREIEKFVEDLLDKLLIKSELGTKPSEGTTASNTGIKPTIQDIARKVSDFTKVDALTTKCKDMAPWIYGTKRMFDEAQKNESLFSAYFNIDSNMRVAPKVTRHLVYALHKHNKTTITDKKIIAQKVFDEIYANIKNDKYRAEFHVPADELDFFITNKPAIQNFISNMVEGIIPEGINTKEIIEILHDVLIIISYFTETQEASNPPQTQHPTSDAVTVKSAKQKEILHDIQKLGQSFCGAIPNIVHDLINTNIETIVQHITARVADMFGESKARRTGGDESYVYPGHQAKIDKLVKSLNHTLSKVITAEDRRLGYVECQKAEIEKNYDEAVAKLNSTSTNYQAELEALQKKKQAQLGEIPINGERTFINNFAKKQPELEVATDCNRKIIDAMEATTKNKEQAIEDLKKTFITEVSQEICRAVLRPATKKDANGKEYEVPWLRVLWNSIKKPAELDNLIKDGNALLDKILAISDINLNDKSKFRKRFINLIQRFTIHIISREIEQAVEKHIIQMLFEMLGDKTLLFNMLFDQLIMSKVWIVLSQNYKTLVKDFTNLHNAAGETEKQQKRNDIAEKLYKILKSKNKDKFQFDKEGITLEQFKEISINYLIKDTIEQQLYNIKKDNKTEVEILSELDTYFKSPNNTKSINHLSSDIYEFIDQIVFGLGKLEIKGTKKAIAWEKNDIFQLFAGLLIPMRNSPYYFLRMYKKRLQEQVSTSGVVDPHKAYSYFSGKGVQQSKPAVITDQQYQKFTHLFHDVIVAPLNDSYFTGGLVRWYMSDKDEKIEAAIRRIITAVYDHPIVELNSLMKLRDVYVT